MGGSALKNCVTRRVQKEEFELIKNEVLEILNDTEITQYAVPEYYKNKESFGDLDIVICYPDYLDLKTVIQNYFSATQEIISNGDCISFEYKQFQIDLIKASKEHFKTTVEYLSYNDIGNLLGRVYHKFGLKYGHKGLTYIIKNKEGYHPKELILSKDIDKILEFGDFNPVRYKFGFNNIEEIYNYVIHSKYFNPEIFSFDTMNHINKIRNKKRATYQGFIDYLNNSYLSKNPEKYFQYNKDKSIYLDRINEYFPESNIFKFIKEYNNELIVLNRVKEKFNGSIVTKYTNLQGKELGKFIHFLKNEFKSQENFNRWCLESTDQEIKDLILYHFNKYNTIIDNSKGQLIHNNNNIVGTINYETDHTKGIVAGINLNL